MEEIMLSQIRKQISKEIDEEIQTKVQDFFYELTDKKDKYISEVMKGIRIIHERDPMTMNTNYRIIFENIIRLEEK